MPRTAREGLCAATCAFVLAVAPVAVADPNVIPIAGGGSALGDSGVATSGSLLQPLSVAVLHDYDFYYREYVIADYDHCRVRQVAYSDQNFDSDVGDISTVVGTGTCGDSGNASEATASTYKLDHPSSVSATPENQILIADSRNGRVDRWSPTTIINNIGAAQTADTVVTLAGTKITSGSCAIPAADSLASSTKFCTLWRVAAHPWYFDTGGGTADKRFLVLDQGCAANTGNCGATAIAPRIYLVYFDGANWRIRTAAIGCGDAGAKPVCFSNPTGMNFTGSDIGEFLVSDAGTNQIQRYAADTNVAEVVAGTGHVTDDSHPMGDDGAPTDATFANPSDVVMTGDGGYYIADTYNCAVRKVTDLTAQALIFSIGGTCGDGLPDTQTVSSFDADLWPAGLVLGSAGLYVADFVTNQVKLFDRTTMTARPARFTNNTRPTFQVEALDGYGQFACAWGAVAEHVCTTSAGGSLEADNTPFQIPLDADAPLTDGEYTFHACISGGSTCSIDNDPNLPVDPTPAEWTFTVDTVLPQGLALISPAEGAGGLSPTPTFTWQAADGGLSGIDHYELTIDGVKNRVVPTSACSGGTCSATPAGPLTEASHTWKVRAVERAGNTADTGARTFASGEAPAASFTVAPNPVLAGRVVTFDASGSSDTSGPIARYQWDLDGDGIFETDGGANPTTTRSYASGPVTVSLLVTDGVGLTGTASGIVTVTAATIAGQLGVTINNGAQYTNKTDVTLSIAAPTSVTQLLVSNDGGFLAASPFAPAKQVAWKLDSSGPERLPKTVYVRFVQGVITSPNYTDDIILDERPPVVDQASVAPGAAVAGASAAKLRTWKVKVKARDSNSGVASVQVTVKKSKPGTLIRYRTKLKVKLASRPKFLRARDRAGNYSRWKKLR